MRFWKRDIQRERSGQEENYSKRTAGEQRVNIQRVDSGYKLARVGGRGTKKQTSSISTTSKFILI